ncbi:MAG TPA: GntR family transcriptional regulator [Steroidobacteraceae bacterium]|nr:GntR family transcriptional regulator [Steroidobacteraceae bacterium]
MNTAERIYVASTCNGETDARLTEELARRIEDDIAVLGPAPGASLGSLRQLSERYQAGRSVTREAVGLLERRGLGRLRPGPCGGFILARPQPETTGVALAEHFLSMGLTHLQLQDAREALQRITQGNAPDPVSTLLMRCLDAVQVGLGGERDAALRPETELRQSPGGTRAASIARRLATEIQRTGGAGVRLGSEWDLCERFGASRLTLRQAIRLLQDSGLVECRRGRGNGLVIRDRRASGSIRLMLAYLISEKLDPITAGTILFQLNAYVPALAVSRATLEQRQQLELSLSRLEGSDSFDRYELLGLVHLVSRLADSPVIDLFSRCLAAYEARFRSSLPERLPTAAHASYFRLMRRLLVRVSQEDAAALDWAKQESAACMLEMSLQRPI